MELKQFGQLFARIRVSSGYRSQRELAERTGVSHSTINRIEAGTHRASPETLKQLAPHLQGATYEDLMEKMGYIRDTAAHPPELYLDPDVQFIARAKQELSPKAFQKMMELAKKAKEMFEDEDGEE